MEGYSGGERGREAQEKRLTSFDAKDLSAVAGVMLCGEGGGFDARKHDLHSAFRRREREDTCTSEGGEEGDGCGKTYLLLSMANSSLLPAPRALARSRLPALTLSALSQRALTGVGAAKEVQVCKLAERARHPHDQVPLLQAVPPRHLFRHALRHRHHRVTAKRVGLEVQQPTMARPATACGSTAAAFGACRPTAARRPPGRPAAAYPSVVAVAAAVVVGRRRGRRRGVVRGAAQGSAAEVFQERNGAARRKARAVVAARQRPVERRLRLGAVGRHLVARRGRRQQRRRGRRQPEVGLRLLFLAAVPLRKKRHTRKGD